MIQSEHPVSLGRMTWAPRMGRHRGALLAPPVAATAGKLRWVGWRPAGRTRPSSSDTWGMACAQLCSPRAESQAVSLYKGRELRVITCHTNPG